MKVKRSSSVCSDEAPSSPDSIASPVSPPPPSDTDLYDEDGRLYSPAYSSDRSSPSPPDYPCLPSPSYVSDQRHYSYEYPAYSPVSPEEAVECLTDKRRGYQADFIRAVQDGNPKELKQILSSYSQMVQINGFTRDGQTALTQSCLHGNLEMVKLLVSHGASIQLTNRDGFSPLHVACFCGKFDVFDYLLQNADGGR